MSMVSGTPVGQDAAMAKPKRKDLPDLTALAQPGAEVSVRVTPRAARDGIEQRDGALRVTVTAVPENGKANAAVQSLLARALGVAPSELRLIRGATARDKTFVIDP